MALLFRVSIQKLGLRNSPFSSPGRLTSPLESDLRFLDVVNEPLGAGDPCVEVGRRTRVRSRPSSGKREAVKEPGVSRGGLLGNDAPSANCTGRWSSSPGRVPRTERTARAAWKAAKHARSTAPCVDPLPPGASGRPTAPPWPSGVQHRRNLSSVDHPGRDRGGRRTGPLPTGCVGSHVWRMHTSPIQSRSHRTRPGPPELWTRRPTSEA